MKDARKEILRRIYISFILICLFGLAIIFQISKIQFAQGEYWRSKADSMTMKYVNIDAARGNIYAADGSPLAFSMPIYDIHFDARKQAISDEVFNAGIDSLALGLSKIFTDKTPQEYRSAGRWWLVMPKTRHSMRYPNPLKTPLTNLKMARKR